MCLTSKFYKCRAYNKNFCISYHSLVIILFNMDKTVNRFSRTKNQSCLKMGVGFLWFGCWFFFFILYTGFHLIPSLRLYTLQNCFIAAVWCNRSAANSHLGYPSIRQKISDLQGVMPPIAGYSTPGQWVFWLIVHLPKYFSSYPLQLLRSNSYFSLQEGDKDLSGY